LVRQVMTGGVVSITVTKLVQKETLPQQSRANQMAVINAVQGPAVPLVVALDSAMLTFVPQHASTAVAGINDQAVPHWTV